MFSTCGPVAGTHGGDTGREIERRGEGGVGRMRGGREGGREREQKKKVLTCARGSPTVTTWEGGRERKQKKTGFSRAPEVRQQ